MKPLVKLLPNSSRQLKQGLATVKVGFSYSWTETYPVGLTDIALIWQYK